MTLFGATLPALSPPPVASPTVRTADAGAVEPASSMTRTRAVTRPGRANVWLAVGRAPLSASSRPSPSKSQTNRKSAPSGSEEPDASNVTAWPTRACAGAVKAAAGGRSGCRRATSPVLTSATARRAAPATRSRPSGPSAIALAEVQPYPGIAILRIPGGEPPSARLGNPLPSSAATSTSPA